MFSHVMVGSSDLARSARFYDAILATVGVTRARELDDRVFYRNAAIPDGPAFAVIIPINGEPACHANGGTIGFRAADEATVDAWHAAGIAAGGIDEGAPSIRGMIKRYGAYLRDHDGNKLCAFVPPEATS